MTINNYIYIKGNYLNLDKVLFIRVFESEYNWDVYFHFSETLSEHLFLQKTRKVYLIK